MSRQPFHILLFHVQAFTELDKIVLEVYQDFHDCPLLDRPSNGGNPWPFLCFLNIMLVMLYKTAAWRAQSSSFLVQYFNVMLIFTSNSTRGRLSHTWKRISTKPSRNCFETWASVQHYRKNFCIPYLILRLLVLCAVEVILFELEDLPGCRQSPRPRRQARMPFNTAWSAPTWLFRRKSSLHQHSPTIRRCRRTITKVSSTKKFLTRSFPILFVQGAFSKGAKKREEEE